MRCFGLLLLCFVFSSCATHTVSHDMAENAINATTAIEKTLPRDCVTDSVKTQLQAVKTQIRAIEQACQTEKAEIRSQKVKWQTAFWGLLAVVGIFVARKVLK